MKHLKTLGLALAFALVVTACGGGDDADATNGENGSSSNTTAQNNSGDPNELTANFNLDDLPGDFDSQLVPPSWTAGQSTDILGPHAVNFETDMSFTDVLAYYEGVIGAPDSIVGDPGEELAGWFNDVDWVASVFDGDPVLVSFVRFE
ncbi:MAG: hypothetical protein GY720_16785, partial [bacterium]|nr:hypothetical protein [bacterium]